MSFRTDVRPPSHALLLVSGDRGDATDRSSYFRTPTVSAGVSFPSRVLDFNGASTAVVTYPDTAELETFPLTVCFWFRIDSAPGANGPSLIGKQALAASPSFLYRGWAIYYSSVTIGMTAVFNEDTFSKYRFSYNSQLGYGDATWRHCTVVFPALNANPTLYINGVSSSLTHGGGSYPTTVATTETLKLGGKSYYEQVSYLNGALDDVRIYRRALSEVEVNGVYAEGLGVTRP